MDGKYDALSIVSVLCESMRASNGRVQTARVETQFKSFSTLWLEDSVDTVYTCICGNKDWYHICILDAQQPTVKCRRKAERCNLQQNWCKIRQFVAKCSHVSCVQITTVTNKSCIVPQNASKTVIYFKVSTTPASCCEIITLETKYHQMLTCQQDAVLTVVSHQ